MWNDFIWCSKSFPLIVYHPDKRRKFSIAFWNMATANFSNQLVGVVLCQVCRQFQTLNNLWDLSFNSSWLYTLHSSSLVKGMRIFHQHVEYSTMDIWNPPKVHWWWLCSWRISEWLKIFCETGTRHVHQSEISCRFRTDNSIKSIYVYFILCFQASGNGLSLKKFGLAFRANFLVNVWYYGKCLIDH